MHSVRSLAAGILFFVVAPAGAQPRPDLDVPFVPTPEETVARMLEIAKVGPDDYLIDLGSGDGRIPIAAAKQFGARGLGVDLDPARVDEARRNAQVAGVADRVEFRVQDLFKTDISRATVVTMYLLPDINIRLRPRLLAELKPGTRVVSHQFTMGDWAPVAKSTAGDARNPIYLWIVPDPKAKAKARPKTPAK